MRVAPPQPNMIRPPPTRGPVAPVHPNRSGARIRYGCTGATGPRVGGGLIMFGWGGATRIYLAAGATDMRKGFEGLYGMARDRLLCDPLSGHVRGSGSQIDAR